MIHHPVQHFRLDIYEEEEDDSQSAKRARREYSGKKDEGEQTVADLAAGVIKETCRPATCMPGVITKFKRYRMSSKGAVGRLHGRCKK